MKRYWKEEKFNRSSTVADGLKKINPNIFGACV
jgi:hypothetical protein